MTFLTQMLMTNLMIDVIGFRDMHTIMWIPDLQDVLEMFPEEVKFMVNYWNKKRSPLSIATATSDLLEYRSAEEIA